jgi:serine/threonine protein kinase
MTATATQLEVESLVGDRYHLRERVGTGGMATVHRAWDERLERDVAVKLIAERLARDTSSLRRFRREAELWARLGHPNIVAILDAGARPREFIAMELVRGPDVGTLLRSRGGRLTPDEAGHVVAQACEALTYAHEHGVLHRDVSPRNILVSQHDGTVKLADFGLACRVDAPDVALPAHVAGTPGYLAPELLSGAAPTPRSDLWSLGAVTRRFLAGPPRREAAETPPTRALATAAPRLLPLAELRPDLPPTLTRAVDQATAWAPHARQGSVAEFRAQLIDALNAVAPAEQELQRAA